jgi:large conductance mechanosensitive channel
MSLLQEFKEFAVKGNAVDLAVGVIIGGAFGKIVSSLVADVIMPPIGILIGGVNFTDLAITLKAAVEAAPSITAKPAVVLSYGKFVQAIVDFVIIAFTIFMMVKGLNSLKKSKEEMPAPPAPDPEPTTEEKLLAEIRDLLKQGR